MSEDIKKIMQQGVTSEAPEVSPEVKAKVEELKSQLLEVIENNREEYENNIPFKVIHEKSGIDYQLISDIILALIMEKKLLGFINDGGTKAVDDDVLILRTKRLLDDLEPEYETGTI